MSFLNKVSRFSYDSGSKDDVIQVRMEMDLTLAEKDYLLALLGREPEEEPVRRFTVAELLEKDKEYVAEGTTIGLQPSSKVFVEPDGTHRHLTGVPFETDGGAKFIDTPAPAQRENSDETSTVCVPPVMPGVPPIETPAEQAIKTDTAAQQRAKEVAAIPETTIAEKIDAAGIEPIPEALLNAKTFREVFDHFVASGIKDAAEIERRCEVVKADVAVLSRMKEGTLRGRIERGLELITVTQVQP